MLRSILLFFAVISVIEPAFASDDLKFQQTSEDELNFASPQAFEKTAKVLKHFNVPDEPDTQPLLHDLSGLQTLGTLQNIAGFLDSKNMFGRFNTVNGLSLSAFQDFDSKKVSDFTVELKPEGAESAPADDFHAHLLEAKRNPLSTPLKGLRIALDPGHMGDALWDARTGKYVVDRAGNKLSEGLLVLQTALLLEEKLKALGAEVLVTHRLPGPVTKLSYEALDVIAYGKEEFRNSTLSTWFQAILNQNLSDSALFSAVEKSQDFKKLFSESKRSDYFILRADLDARAEMINAFKPDLVLVIHMDTSNPPSDPNGLNPVRYNKTKAFVQGNVETQGWSSRKQRRQLARHLLNPYAWNASLNLCRHVVGSIKSQLGLEFDQYDTSTSKMIEPGISARNLALTRQITDTALCYVEALFYNDPVEFQTLRKYTHTMNLDGVQYPYSDRLVQLANALQDAVVSYVSSY